MRVPGRVRDEYETFLVRHGENEFLSFLIKSGSIAKAHYDHPEMMMLDQSDDFFSLYRTTGNNNYFTIGKILRRAAHMLYRDNHKKGFTPINNRFFNLV
jgi:hypothetical protein